MVVGVTVGGGRNLLRQGRDGGRLIWLCVEC